MLPFFRGQKNFKRPDKESERHQTGRPLGGQYNARRILKFEDVGIRTIFFSLGGLFWKITIPHPTDQPTKRVLPGREMQRRFPWDDEILLNWIWPFLPLFWPFLAIFALFRGPPFLVFLAMLVLRGLFATFRVVITPGLGGDPPVWGGTPPLLRNGYLSRCG